jgi:hypothetical protein
MVGVEKTPLQGAKIGNNNRYTQAQLCLTKLVAPGPTTRPKAIIRDTNSS